MSPDEMSDSRLQEIITWAQGGLEKAQALVAAGDLSWAKEVRYFEAKIENFQALLDEREQKRQADIDEIMAPVLAEEAAPLRETVTV